MVYTIDRRGYVIPKDDVTDRQERMIAEQLNVTMEDASGFRDDINFNVFTEDDENYYVPKYWGLENIDPKPNIAFPTSQYADIRFKYENFRFRPVQRQMVSDLFNQFISDDGTPSLKPFQDKFINARTGIGKSALALLMASLLNVPTIVVVHTRKIVKQWKDNIEKHCDNAIIGQIGDGIWQTKGCNFVVATVQSLMKTEKNIESLLKRFDFIIYDEAHHYASPVFSNVLRRLVTRYTLSLSATIKRPDGLEKVLHWYLGDIGVKTEGQLDYDIEIDVIEFTPKEKRYFRELPLPGNKMNTGRMMTNLVKIDERNKMIIDKVHDILKKQPERNLLIISHRIEQIEIFVNEFKRVYGEENIGVIVGMSGKHIVKDNDMANFEGKKIIVGVYDLCKESLDITHICCVVLATPMSRVLQSGGRMLRKDKNLYVYYPLIVDIRDTLSIYRNMGKTRMSQYAESYLNNENSALRFFECSWKTDYKIEHRKDIDLKEFIATTPMYSKRSKKGFNKEKKTHANVFEED